ncbi:ATPase, partial [Enterococcus hirae]
MITVESPLKALKDHLMLNNEGDIWGYYEVTPKTISQNNPKAMQDNKEMMASLLNLLRTYEDIDLTMYPRTLNLRSRFDKLAEGFDPKSREIGEYYANETIHVLEQELGNVYRPSFLLGVKIKDAYIAEDVKELAKKMSDAVVQEIVSLVGYEIADPSALFEQVKLAEQELTQILFSYSIRPLSKNEMIYVNRMQYIRGMKHKIEDENGISNVHNIQSAVLSPLKKGKGILK